MPIVEDLLLEVVVGLVVRYLAILGPEAKLVVDELVDPIPLPTERGGPEGLEIPV